MYTLTSVPTANGGSVTAWGQYSSVRDCTIAARAIQRADPKRERHFEARDLEKQGPYHKILLITPEYTPEVEIVLSDGTAVWLGDVDKVLVEHFGKKEPKRRAGHEYWDEVDCR